MKSHLILTLLSFHFITIPIGNYRFMKLVSVLCWGVEMENIKCTTYNLGEEHLKNAALEGKHNLSMSEA